jgi:uncharacterized protein
MTPTRRTGRPGTDAAFHEGERALQARLGLEGGMEAAGRRAIRDYMPEQHRAFFPLLPFLLVGSVDAQGQPWASVVAGAPGFVSAPDARRLTVRAAPLAGDPLAETLRAGAPIALLGIQPHTRRRNRANGRVLAADAGGFEVDVTQSFGNCPKYIQAREPEFLPGAAEPRPTLRRLEGLDAAMTRTVRETDTFYIASAFRAEESGGAAPYGVDVSHRGGRPGFVRVDDDRTLTVPDFMGNFYFNTLGNLLAQPRAGLLFVDFASGDLLYLACAAEIVFDGPELAAFEGAQRLLRFRVHQALLLERALPLRWSAAEPAPELERTGRWSDVAAPQPETDAPQAGSASVREPR